MVTGKYIKMSLKKCFRVGLAITYLILGISIFSYIIIKGKTFYNKRYWKFCILLALPIIFHNLSNILLGQSDRVMLQQLGTNTMVGIYSLASGFSSVLSTIWNALNNSWVPFYYEYTRLDKINILKKRATYYIELFTILAVGFILLAPEVYHIYAGSEYWSGTSIITILAIGYYMTFLYSFPVNFEFFHKKTNKGIKIITNSAINQPHLSWRNENGTRVPNYKERLNRQYLPACYMETGAFMISRASVVTQKTRIGSRIDIYELPENEAIDVDTFEDLQTVNELAMLGIPSIAMAQNHREEKHGFVCNENGFSYIGLNPPDEVIENTLNMYIQMSASSRERYQKKLLSHDLRGGRKRVMALINGL